MNFRNEIPENSGGIDPPVVLYVGKEKSDRINMCIFWLEILFEIACKMSQKSLRNLKMNKIWGCEHRFAFSKDNVIWLAQEPVIVMHCRLEFTLLISLGYMHCIHRCQIHGLVDHLSLVDPWIAASQKLWISLFLNATVCSSLTWLITHISVSFLSLKYCRQL